MGPFVNSARNELLAGAGFPGNENRRIRRCDLGHTRKDGLQRGRLADDLLKHRGLIDFFPQRNVLFVKLILQFFDFVKSALKVVFRPLAVRDIRPDAAHSLGLTGQEKFDVIGLSAGIATN